MSLANSVPVISIPIQPGSSNEFMGIQKILMTVNDNNTPSWKVMESNGAILEKTDLDEKDGRLSRFYWINL